MDELRRLDAGHDSMDEPLGVLRDPLAARSRTRKPGSPRIIAGRHRELDLWMALILTVAQLALGALLSFVAFVSELTFDGCGSPNPECNYSLGATALYVVPVACVIALGITVFGVMKRRARSVSCWWVPVAAFCISLVGFTLALLLIVLATGRPL